MLKGKFTFPFIGTVGLATGLKNDSDLQKKKEEKYKHHIIKRKKPMK